MSLTEILLIAICFMVSQIFGIALNLFGRKLINDAQRGEEITAEKLLLRIGGLIASPTLGSLGLIALMCTKQIIKES